MARVVLLLLSALLLDVEFHPERLPDPQYEAKRGDRAVVANYDEQKDRLQPALLSTQRYVYEEYWKALDIDDNDGADELWQKKLMVLVPQDTPVLVLDVETFGNDDPRPACCVVRVLKGKYQGRKFWMPRFEVCRLLPRAEAEKRKQ